MQSKLSQASRAENWTSFPIGKLELKSLCHITWVAARNGPLPIAPIGQRGI